MRSQGLGCLGAGVCPLATKSASKDHNLFTRRDNMTMWPLDTHELNVSFGHINSKNLDLFVQGIPAHA